MPDKVVKLELVEMGEGFRFEANQILDGARDQPFTIISVIGQLEDGTIWVTGSANAGETMILLERAKKQIIDG